uniref:LIM zinc-binding domain-containing protein n=2 Tax=Wuchereria bancrofti TaxID=6293 RepID=A0AAF5Q093_WUCBA
MTSISPVQLPNESQWRSERSDRSESRASSRYVPLDHSGTIHNTLNTMVDSVNAATELIQRKQNEYVKSFQTEMEVNGRISVEPTDNILRLKSVGTEDMQKELTKLKGDQKQNAVTDTLAALVYDIDATAEVLRRGSMKKKRTTGEEVITGYNLRITPGPEEEIPIPSPKQHHATENSFTLERVSRDYGVDISESQMNSIKKRARSETPRRMINIESSPTSSAAICAFCSEKIDGPIITALAPNSFYAQKFHPYHFMCTYCQKALNLRGTYREHERKPYCHECFYRLYNGLIYSPDEKQARIEKLI